MSDLVLGFIFIPDSQNMRRLPKPATYYGSAHTFKFEMGPAMKEALIKSVEAAYSKVSILRETPKPGEFDRDISFDLQSSNVQVEFVPGFWNASAKANAIIHVSMEIIDGKSSKTIQRLAISGNGSSTKDTSGGGDAQKQFSEQLKTQFVNCLKIQQIY